MTVAPFPLREGGFCINENPAIVAGLKRSFADEWN